MSKSRIEKDKKIIISLLILVIVIIAVALNYNSIQRIIYPQKYKGLVDKYSAENKLDSFLIYSIIKAESGFNPEATSNRNAMGLMQLTENTARWGAEQLNIKNFKVKDLYKPEINIRIGCWYVNRLMKEFEGNTENVIAAYNGGSGNVKKWLKDRSLSTTGKKLRKIPFKETENFVKRVTGNYKKYKLLYPIK